jgi:hypothetical protein
VIPEVDNSVLGEDSLAIEEYRGLQDWVGRISECWEAYRSPKSPADLIRGRLDFQHKLSSQFPMPEFRVLYNKSGTHLSAMWTQGTEVIDHCLYWAPVSSLDEARFLVAILNSAVTTWAVEPLMSYGKDARHFDKYVWQLPIPTFDAAEPTHQRLVELSTLAEGEVAALDLREGERDFPWQRQQVRKHLARSKVGNEIEALVATLFGT